MDAIVQESAPLTGAKVLIIDDEPIIRQRLKELGEKLGFETQTAADGFEALEQFNALQPDLVILDVYMPKMNGLAVLNRMREISPTCPIILISGFLAYEQFINLSRTIKPDGCLMKPLNHSQTASLMLKLVRTRSANHKSETV